MRAISRADGQLYARTKRMKLTIQYRSFILVKFVVSVDGLAGAWLGGLTQVNVSHLLNQASTFNVTRMTGGGQQRHPISIQPYDPILLSSPHATGFLIPL